MPAKKWTKKKVIEEIRERQRQGLPLTTAWRDDLALYSAAKVHFGGWRKALHAMGIKDFPPPQKWTKRRVRDAILKRYRLGILAATHKEDVCLHSAAAWHFGSWRDALTAAGLQGKCVTTRRWTKDLILEAIRERQQRGLPLHAITRHDPTLYAAANRHFGSWRKAVTAADVDVKWPRSWDRDRVLREIQSRHQCGKRLTNVSQDDSALVWAACRYFGTWNKAILAAGFEPLPRRKWTRQRIIQALGDWYASGMPTGSVWEHDPSLGAAARKQFGSWREALKAAGIAPQSRSWTRESVIRELRAWRRGKCRVGLSVADRQLAAAAVRHFGSSENALREAGLEPRPRGRSDDQLIEAIQDRYIRGLPLTPVLEVDVRLMSGAKARFGSWRKALSAAGMDNVLPPPRLKWTADRVIAEIQRWHDQGLPLARVRTDYSQLASAAARYFGGWKAALEAAGVEARKRSWSKESIIAEIKDRDRRGLPTQNMRRHDSALEAIACWYFGSWGKAMNAAGLEAYPWTRWTAQRVIEEIQRWHEQGRPLTRVWKEYATLTSAAIRYFGSWRRAVAAAEIPGK